MRSAKTGQSSHYAIAAVAARFADIQSQQHQRKRRASRPAIFGVPLILCQCGHVLEAQFVGLAQHPVHEEAEDAEDRVEAHVGGHGP